jgi:uncharacterized protein (TIGR03435 family)
MTWEFFKLTMSGLAELLAPHVDRPVVDMTNVPGSYRLVFQNQGASAGRAQSQKTSGPPEDQGDVGSARQGDTYGEGLIRAIERGGLKLEPRRAPIEVIVVDRLEKTPTAN